MRRGRSRPNSSRASGGLAVFQPQSGLGRACRHDSEGPTDQQAGRDARQFSERTKRNQVTSATQEKRHRRLRFADDGYLRSTGRGTELATQRPPSEWRAPQSPSASESANFSSHLTSNGRSRTGSSSIFCESSRSVGSLLAMVSCSVS